MREIDYSSNVLNRITKSLLKKIGNVALCVLHSFELFKVGRYLFAAFAQLFVKLALFNDLKFFVTEALVSLLISAIHWLLEVVQVFLKAIAHGLPDQRVSSAYLVVRRRCYLPEGCLDHGWVLIWLHNLKCDILRYAYGQLF